MCSPSAGTQSGDAIRNGPKRETLHSLYVIKYLTSGGNCARLLACWLQVLSVRKTANRSPSTRARQTISNTFAKRWRVRPSLLPSPDGAESPWALPRLRLLSSQLVKLLRERG